MFLKKNEFDNEFLSPFLICYELKFFALEYSGAKYVIFISIETTLKLINNL